MITPTDLLSPKGPVEVTLFPGESASSPAGALWLRLEEYIDQAYTKIVDIAFPEPDPAAQAWALYLTFKAAHILAASRPNTENTLVQVLGSKGYAPDQRKVLQEQRDAYLAEYESLSAAIPSRTTPVGPQSRSTTINYEY